MSLLLIDLLRCWGRQGEVLGFEEDRQAQLAAERPLSWGHPPGPSTGPHPYPSHQEQGNIMVTSSLHKSSITVPLPIGLQPGYSHLQ